MDFSLLFLGTCACDYSPKLKNEYKNCFDKDARRSSCALLDGQYLIDCGEHCLESMGIAGTQLSAITDIFITHFHSDHYNPEHIKKVAEAGDRTLRVWVRSDAVVPEIPNVSWKYMEKGKEYEIGDFKVVGLLANHDECVYPQHLLFEKGDKRFLYACDGAWFLNETYYRLKNVKLSLLVLDATCGDYLGDYRIGEHNTIPMIRLLLPSLKKWGAITEETKIYLSHLAPSLHKPHFETVELVKSDGLDVAYDGLEIKI